MSDEIVAPVVETPAAATPDATVETPAVVETPAEDTRLAEKFAALSAREKAAVQREAAIKANEAKVAAWEAAQTKAKESPLEYLKSVGLTLDDIAAHAMKIAEEESGTADPVKALADKVEKFEAEQKAKEEAAEKAKTDAQTSAFENAKNVYRTKAEQYLSEDATREKYDLCSLNPDVPDLVVQTTLDHHAATGVFLEMDVVLDAIEKQLEEESEVEFALISKSKKWQQKIGMVKTDAPVESNTTPKPKSSTTMTTKDTATPAAKETLTPPTADNYEAYTEARLQAIKAKYKSA